MPEWLAKLLDPQIISDFVGLAVNSGTAFYAVICLLLGVAVSFVAPHRLGKAIGAFLVAMSAVMMLVTTFGPAPNKEPYKFWVRDQVPVPARPVVLEAENGTELWLKGIDSFLKYHAVALYSPKLPDRGRMSLVVTEASGKQHRVSFERCHMPNGLGESDPVHLLRAAQDPQGDSGEGPVWVFSIVPDTDTCGGHMVMGGLWRFMAAHAQVKIDQSLTMQPRLHSTNDIILQYYSKEADGASVAQAFEGFAETEAFVLDMKTFEVPINLMPSSSPSRSPELETNAVWYGSDVPVEIAGRLAASLIEKGVELRYFGPFVRVDTRINTIEAGHSLLKDGDPVLSLEDIQAKTCKAALAQDCDKLWVK